MKFTGTVVRGHEVGGKFGIATANLEVADLEIEEGVYFVEVVLDDSTQVSEYTSTQEAKIANGLLHVGPRKTFGSEFSIEVHLLNFEQDLYSKKMEVEILQFLRPVKQFENADALFTQIEHDIMQAEKFFLRRKVGGEWKMVSGEWRKEVSEQAVKAVSEFDAFQDAQIILAFAPQRGREVEFVEPLMKQFPDKEWYFPMIEKDELSFYRVDAWSDLVIGRFGILEPDEDGSLIRFNDTDKNVVVFVPAVATDGAGNRTGRGKGFYDKFLATFNKEHPTSTTITVVPDFAVVEKIPTEEHDQRVDTVISV